MVLVSGTTYRSPTLHNRSKTQFWKHPNAAIRPFSAQTAFRVSRRKRRFKQTFARTHSTTKTPRLKWLRRVQEKTLKVFRCLPLNICGGGRRRKSGLARLPFEISDGDCRRESRPDWNQKGRVVLAGKGSISLPFFCCSINHARSSHALCALPVVHLSSAQKKRPALLRGVEGSVVAHPELWRNQPKQLVIEETTSACTTDDNTIGVESRILRVAHPRDCALGCVLDDPGGPGSRSGLQ